MKLGAKPYTPKEVAQVFRAVLKHLSDHQQLLREEGVLRIAAQAGGPSEIIVKNILENKPFISDSNSVHDYIDALKQVLKRNVLLDDEDPLVQDFAKAIMEHKGNEEKGAEKAAEALEHFIKKLVSSGDSDKAYIAEFIHNYLHIAKLVGQYQDDNKMNVRNLSIVVGTIFFNNIVLVDDPQAAANLTGVFNKTMEEAIKSQTYNSSFDSTYAVEISNIRFKLHEAENHRLKLAQNLFASQFERFKEHNEKVVFLKDDLLNHQLLLEKVKSSYKQRLRSKEEFKECEMTILNKMAEIQQNLERISSIANQTGSFVKQTRKSNEELSSHVSALERSLEKWMQKAYPEQATSQSSPRKGPVTFSDLTASGIGNPFSRRSMNESVKIEVKKENDKLRRSTPNIAQ